MPQCGPTFAKVLVTFLHLSLRSVARVRTEERPKQKVTKFSRFENRAVVLIWWGQDPRHLHHKTIIYSLLGSTLHSNLPIHGLGAGTVLNEPPGHSFASVSRSALEVLRFGYFRLCFYGISAAVLLLSFF